MLRDSSHSVGVFCSSSCCGGQASPNSDDGGRAADRSKDAALHEKWFLQGVRDAEHAHMQEDCMEGAASGRRRLSGLRPRDPLGPGVDTNANPAAHKPEPFL